MYHVLMFCEDYKIFVRSAYTCFHNYYASVLYMCIQLLCVNVNDELGDCGERGRGGEIDNSPTLPGIWSNQIPFILSYRKNRVKRASFFFLFVFLVRRFDRVRENDICYYLIYVLVRQV